MSASIRILAVTYVLGSSLALIVGSIVGSAIVGDRMRRSGSIPGFFADYPIAFYFLFHALLLSVYLPAILGRIHHFGWLRRLVLVVLPIPGAVIGFLAYNSTGSEVVLPGGGSPRTDRTYVPSDRNADANELDPLGESAKKVVYLDQGWTSTDSQRFYFTSQGSQILPYDWFLVLEQPSNERLFRDSANMLGFRYLTQKSDVMNPDGLPVGFVKDTGKNRDWLGLTCAACHTAEIHYKGTAYRIDGGPSLGDITSFVRSLTDALKAAHDADDKFMRFANSLPNAPMDLDSRSALKLRMKVVIDRLQGYMARNFPPGNQAGNGRIDLFGAIFNEIFHRAIPDDQRTTWTVNTNLANAPVSMAGLWDTPQHDFVIWNGSSSNSPPAVGALGRNVAQCLGVFVDFEIPKEPNQLGYPSTVRVQNLRSIEEWLSTLWSPHWPNDFPPIDLQRSAQGKSIYDQQCLECHERIDRKDPRRKIKSTMRGVGTDPLMATNFEARRGASGILAGAFSRYFSPTGTTIGAKASGTDALSNVVIGIIVGSYYPAPNDEVTSIELGHRPLGSPNNSPIVETSSRYKARPLNGVWATAPYLHNGSVPTLYDLLKPAAERPKSFSVGNREFDPDKVGFKTDAMGFYTCRVVDENGKGIPGNSNAGHEYGAKLSEDERGQLLEYLKSL